jgi:hypothetical protein
LKYLNAPEEALVNRQPHSDTAVSASVGISRMTLWKWRQLQAFCAWVRERIDKTSDWNWPLVLRRHELLAIEGSVRSAEFILKVRSGVYNRGKGGEAASDPAKDYTVNYLVLSPDDVASSVVLPLDDPKLTEFL